VTHGIIDVVAFQEALLIEAIFGIAVLVMFWVGFRRWLQYKEKLGHHIAEQTAALAAQHGARLEDVESRLKAVEQVVSDGVDQPAGHIGSGRVNSLPDPIVRPDEA
jgi:hypothetical protein